MTDLISEDSLFDDISNPLDGVEDVLTSQKWTFNRANREFERLTERLLAGFGAVPAAERAETKVDVT